MLIRPIVTVASETTTNYKGDGENPGIRERITQCRYFGGKIINTNDDYDDDH